jgi:transposase
MFRFEADLKVFLHREPIDFRAGINSLVMLVEQSMQLDPFARVVFAFHNCLRRPKIEPFVGVAPTEN